MTRQQAVLFEFLKDYIRVSHGVCPSFKEMADALGLKSKSGIFRLLTALERQGKIERRRHHRRAIIVVDAGPPTADELHDMVMRLCSEEGPTRTIAALVDLAQEIAPQIGAA